ncbi:MAG TPA: ParB/RepB/Spo0J family partition protein [Phycisphaerae bacterium]|nr:ParB/RepB/Spo0J family partition protein [Phycisphaerae bacterium]
MPAENKRLGRGLDSVLSSAYEHTPDRLSALADQPPAAPAPPAKTIAIEAIEPNPFQPRQLVDEQALAQLSESLRRDGLLQPLVVRQRGGRYELIVGHRRWQAARLAGLTTLPAVVRQASDQQMLELALIENIQREDLNPIDRALAYRHYHQAFGLSAEQIAERLGEDRSTVANYLRLLDLPDDVRKMVAAARLGMGQARALLGLGQGDAITRFATRIIEDGLSVRQVERLVQQRRAPREPTTAPQKRPLIQQVEEAFAANLGTKVHVFEGRKKNSGRIVIHYRSLDDFDRIVERLNIPLEEQ